MLIMDYARSPFRDFETYLRIVVGLDEDDNQLSLKHCISYFITYEIPQCIYWIKHISEVVNKIGDHEGTLHIEYADITKKTKLFLN